MTDGVPRRDMTLFRLECLAAIGYLNDRQETVVGLDVLELLRERLETDLPHSRCYQNLDWLEERELLTKELVYTKKNDYALTPAGRDELGSYAEWFRQAAGLEHRLP